MSISLTRLGKFIPFSRIFRQVEQETETVIGVLQPGPLGIIEHRYSAAEVRDAKVVIEKALAIWRRNAILEKRSPIMKDYIDI